MLPFLFVLFLWSKPTTRFWHSTILRSAHTACLCVLCGSENKQRLFSSTTLTDWFLYQRFNPSKPCGYYLYHQVLTFNNPTFCPHSVFVVLYGSEDKEQLFPYTTLTDRFLHQRFNPLKPCGFYMYHQVFTFNNSTFCPHSVFVCFVWIWEQTSIISLYNINWLVLIPET